MFRARSVLKSVNVSSKIVLRQSRYLHSSRSILAATTFDMPAMSPTMESGAIVEWKIKEGDRFNSGDSLLEIETDKSTISVDAIDDGILAKIILPDGTKDIPVGTPIAFMAEDGDDINTLEYPSLDAKNATNAVPESTPVPKPTPTQAAKEPVAEPTLVSENKTKTYSEGSISNTANPNQVFFPSVELLLTENKISKEDALKNIPATGPHGRLLKGDVLAYLGKIPKDLNSSIASYLKKTSHLDLSNIELRKPVESKSESSKSSAPTTKPKVVVSETLPVNIEVRYSQMNAFKSALSEIIEITEHQAYAENIIPASDLDDPLFDEIIAPARNADRFTVTYKLNTDECDVESLDLELTLNEKCFDAKDRAELFVKYFKANLAEFLKDSDK